MILEQESNNHTIDFIFRIFFFFWVTPSKSLFFSSQETWLHIRSLQNPSDFKETKDK